MDPVTIAGLVLAALPLMIPVFQSLDAISEPLVRLCRTKKEARRFQRLLNIQSAKFLAECGHLLCEVTLEQDAMLRDPEHVLWKDKSLAQQLGNNFGMGLRSCHLAIELIHETLDDIMKETYGGFSSLSSPRVSKIVVSVS
jgi:hypothetical protein